VPGLKSAERKDIANALNIIADRAHDLDEIADRLLLENHSPEEIAELLFAFDTIVDYIRSYSDSLGSGLLTIFDRIKGLETPNRKNHLGRSRAPAK
jgi:hypothetical protein